MTTQMHLPPVIHLVVVDAYPNVFQYFQNYCTVLCTMQYVWYNGWQYAKRCRKSKTPIDFTVMENHMSEYETMTTQMHLPPVIHLVVVDAYPNVFQYFQNYCTVLCTCNMFGIMSFTFYLVFVQEYETMTTQMHLPPVIHLVVVDAYPNVFQYFQNYCTVLCTMQYVWYNGWQYAKRCRKSKTPIDFTVMENHMSEYETMTTQMHLPPVIHLVVIDAYPNVFDEREAEEQAERERLRKQWLREYAASMLVSTENLLNSF
ncbi:hypothetical protein V8G54_004692 [Vigna mungo]|uniref:Uncharacterized protein n=1 Tax=Vigna mungo TaxID=3915 RepID=A0AAQ3SEG2_VIGMU